MKKKIIGVCLTRISEQTNAEFIKHLNLCAAEHGYKLIVFNSVVDYYYGDSFDKGARTIFSYINYNVLDGVIICAEQFWDKTIIDEVIANAKEHDIPAVIVGAEYDGCWGIKRDYANAFKELMNHVIRKHKVTDTFFIAGIKNTDESDKRIACYREALEENGLRFSEDNVDYGDYWEDPTRLVVDRLFERSMLPQAIFCANDYMAIAVCEIMAERGVSVPHDVIVTGFDGVPEANFFTPHLTTCTENIPALARMSIESIASSFAGAAPEIINSPYIPCIAASCGCDSKTTTDRELRQLFRKMQSLESNETFVLSIIDRMCECTDFKELCDMLSECLISNSCICLISDFVNLVSDSSFIYPDELYIIPERGCTSLPLVTGRAGMLPDFDEWLRDNSIYVLTASYMGATPCGYYAAKIHDITVCANQINLIVKAINIGFSSYTNFLNRVAMESRVANAETHNVITKLPNLRAANEWFDNFASYDDSHYMALTVSVYCLQQYKNIYEKYGFMEAGEVILEIADALTAANRDCCYVAQLADDEFVVINYYINPDEISDTIDAATSAFFKRLGDYNSTSGKEFFAEVNCGCTVVNPGWHGTLASFTKLATAEMYVNRLNAGKTAPETGKTVPKDLYPAFNALVEKNLFIYHFQPIVNAHTGEIFAYEALMRTDPSIGMNPMQVLDTAEAYQRLYDIERATMFNVMERYDSEIEYFMGRKVFINSIPGYFLNQKDAKTLSEKYSHLMSHFVFEITEQNAVSEEELDTIRHFGNELNYNQIAIDDYGTGHSNIVNLLRYTPQIIKIDRYLITDIQKDVNKQMFVKSTIEFARMNNIKVLAEGVETSEELQTVIRFGVDYIQGYYTGRPQFEPLAEIAESIREEIISANA